MHASRRDVAHEFKSIRKHLKISFLSALHNKRTPKRCPFLFGAKSPPNHHKVILEVTLFVFPFFQSSLKLLTLNHMNLKREELSSLYDDSFRITLNHMNLKHTRLSGLRSACFGITLNHMNLKLRFALSSKFRRFGITLNHMNLKPL